MIAELLAEHGSPLWLVDVDRVRDRLRAFRAAWAAAWPDTDVAYSYKANRHPAILRALAAEGAGHEVTSGAEYALAHDVAGADGAAIVVNGPAKPADLLDRAGRDGALVIVDSAPELERAAASGVGRVGVRVAVHGLGVGATRFGVEARQVPATVAMARAGGMTVEALACHVVSTGLRRPLTVGSTLAEAAFVRWPPQPARHVRAAASVASIARELGVDVVDLGGGHPPPPALHHHAHAVADVLRRAEFAGRVLLEPGRAIVADAVDLAVTVVAVKHLHDGARCLIVDGGTNLLAGVLSAWPVVDTAEPEPRGPRTPAFVTGPLCLETDVLHPAAPLPPLRPGDVLVVRAVGAYHQVQSTQFGDLRPAVVARDEGGWHRVTRSESIDDIIAGDVAAGAAAGAGKETYP